MKTAILDWLMSGDASIRPQTQRDLLDAPPVIDEPGCARISETGWEVALLARQDAMRVLKWWHNSRQ